MSPTTTIYKQHSWTEESVKSSKPVATKFVSAVQERTFTGDMEGYGVAAYILSYFGPVVEGAEHEAKASYAGQMLFDGSIGGEKGTVSINTTGIFDAGDIEAKWVICTETATGELVGIKGTGGYAVKGVSCGSGVECRLDVEW